jgi:pentapeptide MXKDX repeat protein
MPFFLPEEVEMNKFTVALLSGCLALSGSLALAQGNMNGNNMNKGGMSMEKAAPGDNMSNDAMSASAMQKGSMKKETMDQGMMKRETTPEHGMKHKNPKKMRPSRAKEDKKPEAMRRMQ